MRHHQFTYRENEAQEAFLGTNFGGVESTEQGRRSLVAECILKLACGYADGSTIKQICHELGALTAGYNPRLSARQWAYTEQARASKDACDTMERAIRNIENGNGQAARGNLWAYLERARR